MKLLVVVAAVLVVVSAASLSLEDLEFHAWKLKYGKRPAVSHTPPLLISTGLLRTDLFAFHPVYLSLATIVSVLAEEQQLVWCVSDSHGVVI